MDNSNKPLKVFDTITAKELYELNLPEIKQMIECILFQGLTVFAGSGKIGKSFAVLYMCMCVSDERELWGRKILKGTTLYLALVDNNQRIQIRMDRIIEGTGFLPPENMHIVTMAEFIKSGLEEQIHSFIKANPDTVLIAIDTFQKIRGMNSDRNIDAYALDYEEIGILKALVDKYNVAILLMHHLRKAGDGDEFNKISGSTGISGAADNLMMLSKEKRMESTVTLQITGRDSADTKLVLEFDRAKFLWNLVSEEADKYLYENEAGENIIVKALIKFMENRMVWENSPSELLNELKKIDIKIPDMPNVLTRRINHYKDYLFKQGIDVASTASNGKRTIIVTNVHT